LTGEAVSLIQDVIADARNRSAILDTCQESAAGACNVYGAEGTAGVDEAVAVVSGVAVKAGDLPGVVDAERGRAGRERKVDRGEHAGLVQKPVESRCIRPSSDDVAGGIDPGGRGPGGPMKSIAVKVPPLLTNPCSTLAASK
jgi:hypothetical protein